MRMSIYLSIHRTSADRGSYLL